jgi:hypothetical protein
MHIDTSSFPFVPLADLMRKRVKGYVDAHTGLMDAMLKHRAGHKHEAPSWSTALSEPHVHTRHRQPLLEARTMNDTAVICELAAPAVFEELSSVSHDPFEGPCSPHGKRLRRCSGRTALL